MRNWGELARVLMGWYGSEGRKKLDAIERQHTSNNARLKAVVEAFLLGERHHGPSWRKVIYALYEAGETNMAETIKTNAEPQQGEWVCTISQYIHNASHMT